MRLKLTVTVLSVILLTGCSTGNMTFDPTQLNGKYNDEQPTLSGDGQWVAFVTNRYGNTQIVLYNLREKRFQNLPKVNRSDAISQSPSLSYTGRYLVYLTSERGFPQVALFDRLTQRSQIITQGYRSWVRYPTISPNGRYISFETAKRGQWDIEVIDLGDSIEPDIPDGTIIPQP